MNKKYVIIKYNDKPILISPVVDGTSEEFLKIKKEAESQFNTLQKTFDDIIKDLNDQILDLKKEIRRIKGEE